MMDLFRLEYSLVWYIQDQSDYSSCKQATRWRTHRGDSPPSLPTHREANEALYATSALLHSALPSTITPEPHQTALATELIVVCTT